MNDDDTFRLLLLIVAVMFMPLGLYHRIRSHTGEKLDRWQEGVVILFGLRLTALAMFASGVAWMIDPRWMAWSALPIPAWLRWLGFAVAVCAGVLWVWTVHTGQQPRQSGAWRRPLGRVLDQLSLCIEWG